jgi:hypothetical protein
MRKVILIAGFVLASAAAQAGDSRSLSLAGSDAQSAAAPARTNVAPQIAEATEAPKVEAPRAAEPPQAETPRYTERPAIVDKPDRYRDEEPRYKDESRTKDEPRNRNESRYKDEPRDRDESKYRDEPRSKGERRYSDSRRSYDDDDDRYERPRRTRHWAERRVINALHRHGIYW